MLMMDGWMRSSVLHLPVQYTVALPQKALRGERAPLILLLHDLGEGRDQWRDTVRLAMLVEKHQLALVMPDGRRSCFQDMAHGPQWNTWLTSELPDCLGSTLCVNGVQVGAVGIGIGALGAFRFAAERKTDACAAIDPSADTVLAWHADEWPHQREWEGVFGSGDKWDREKMAQTHGLMLGQADKLAQCVRTLGVTPWRQDAREQTELEAQLDYALAYCVEKLV